MPYGYPETVRDYEARDLTVCSNPAIALNKLPTTSRPIHQVRQRLIQSALPEAWRYFGINNYREISALIPETWLERVSDLEHLRPDVRNSCHGSSAPVVEDSFDDD